MTEPQLSALLIDAPVGRHFAQLHRQEESRAESVSLYIETGLRRGNAVVAFATSANTDQYLERLQSSGIDAEAYRRSGKLRLLDADAVLGRFMQSGMPVWSTFKQTVGGVLDDAQAFGQSTTRAYGEMVNVLWQQGEAQAAIQLEGFWNDLGRIYPFALFCTYMVDCQDAACYHHPIEEIGHSHTDVLSTPDDERFREALDAASRDVFGTPLTGLVGMANLSTTPGEDRLPAGQRTMLWIMRNMPASSAAVLERARHHFQALRA